MCGNLLGHQERVLFDKLNKSLKAEAKKQVYYQQGYQAGWCDDKAIDLKPNRASQNNQSAWLNGYNQGCADRKKEELKKMPVDPTGVKKLKDIAQQLRQS